MRKLAFRPTLTDTKRANDAAHKMYAALSGRETPEGVMNNVKPKVSRGPRKVKVGDEPKEHDEQKAVVTWWWHYSRAHQLSPNLLVAIPNAQALLKFANNPNAFLSYLKYEGMRAGMADLVLFVARGRYHGLVIEMKRKTKSVVSDEQDEMLRVIREQGYMSCVCWGADNAIMRIEAYMEHAV